MARHFDLQSWLLSKIWQDIVTLLISCNFSTELKSRVQKHVRQFYTILNVKEHIFPFQYTVQRGDLTSVSPFEHDIECQCKCQPQTEAKVDDGGDDDYALVMGRQ